MLQKPNTVFVGPNVNLETSTLTAGEIFVANANTGAVLDISTDSIATALGADTRIKIGYTKADGTLTYSPDFSKEEVTNLLTNAYSANVEASAELDFTDATVVVGHRYVVRCIYKDIYEHPGQFTHSYEAIATTSSTADLAATFMAKINRHVGRRVDASIYEGVKASKAIGGITFEAVNAGVAGNDITVQFLAAGTAAINVTNKAIVITPATGQLTLAAIQAQIAGSATAAALIKATAGTATGSAVSATALEGGVDATLSTLKLTAKEVTPNGFGTQGKEAITPYSQVMLNVVTFTTIIDSRLNSAKDSYGVVITLTPSKPGKGNPYIIRDREQAALAYKGITNRITWPIIKPELNVDLSVAYDELIIELKKKYQSPDNQYEKDTKLAIECYVEEGATADAGDLYDKLAAWIA